MAYIETKPIALDLLDLDPDNPRLPESMDRNPKNIFRFLALSSSIDELVSAIGSNGYFDSEPLIGLPSNGRVVIVEGNRRLTALKLLHGESFADLPSKVQEIIDDAAHRPKSAPVALYEERNDVLNYLGNKHIAGVKPWGSLAKARYARQLFDAAPDHLSYNDRIRFVARTIGSRFDFIARALKALEAYRVAERSDFFGLSGIDEETVKFSLLSTALDYEGIQDYVYVDSTLDPLSRDIKEDNLKNIFSWMFQPFDGKRTRLGESRNLIQLSKVVAHEGALDQFIRGAPLAQAFKLTDGINQEFDNLTIKIQNDLRDANSIVAEVDFTESRASTVGAIIRQARQLKSAFEDNDDI